MGTTRLRSVSVGDYLAMRGYFEEVVRWAFATDADIRSEESRRLRTVVEGFVASAGAMLGVDRNGTLAQVGRAQQEGRTHCDLVVDADQMVDLTHVLLDFLEAVEDLRARRPMLAPAPPSGVRAFILACQERLQHEDGDARLEPLRKQPRPLDRRIGPMPAHEWRAH